MADALLIKEASIDRLARVALLADRFEADAVPMIYGEYVKDRRDVWRFFSSDLVRCVNAAQQGETMAKQALTHAMVSGPAPLIVDPNRVQK